MLSLSEHLPTTLRDSAQPLTDQDLGVLRFLPSPLFSVYNRDVIHAEFCTLDGKYGQVCKALRESGFYPRGEWLTGKVSTGPRYDTIESAIQAALDQLSAPGQGAR
ncbi:hypothetical protein [Nonomuraea turcica]|uniref:hypothetical protein n=1 Tax=Nonomuraea sp. G32 TaxID=3067274 RepID=UPI00273B77B0|nr:hypothetical protein [Nonomuraea sp. G32]MDP4510317.1 hypothetical protein [Nonomuraea sp. G32]